MAAAAKRERGICKGGLTRAEKTLYALLGRKRPLLEVKNAYENVETAYHDLVEAHRAYLREVPEEQLEAVEAWMEPLSDGYDKMGMDVNDYEKTFTQPEPAPNADARVATPAAEKLSLKVDRVERPTFSGKVLDYFQFRKDFKFVFGEKYSDAEALYCLRKAVSDDAKKWLVGIDNCKDAWEILDQQYGDSRVMSDSVLASLSKTKQVPEEDSVKFANLYHQVKSAKDILGELDRANDLDNSTTLATIESKLSYNDRLKWARFQLEKTLPPKIDNFLLFMSVEIEIKRIAGAEIRSSVSGSGGQKSGKVCAETGKIREGNGNGKQNSPSAAPAAKPNNSAAAVARAAPGTQSQNNGQSHKFSCWACNSDSHRPHECAKFIAMNLSNRLAEVRKNKACYFCLNKHYGPCRQRKKCTQMTDSVPCKYSHHALLHGAPFESGSTIAGIEGALINCSPAEDRSLLPIIEGDISNLTNGLTKSNVCIFLDSGASLSLIKEDTAKQLGLQGENVTVTIGKIGATEEDFRTKLYTLYVGPKGGGNKFRVQAVGIPEICGEIAKVRTDEIAKLFGVNQLHRGSGNPDLLIGLDFVKFHTGETIVKGDLALRHSPLGPVVFGVTEGTEQNSKSVSGVYLTQEIRRAKEVNLGEFWSAEEMGIAVNPCCVEPKPEHKRMSPIEKAEDERIRKSAIKVGDQWMIPIPWKKDPHDLPDNYSQAYARLVSTEKKLSQNGEYARMYSEQIEDLEARGCARKLTQAELDDYKGPTFYLSHHAVLRPEKQSTPCRVVFNSAAIFQGHSLNEYQCKGPDLLNSLLGVLLRFREKPICIYGDISKMYHSVLISPTVDANTHRFLWRGMENRPPDVYKKLVLTFGDKCSPALANTALNLTAKEFVTDYPEAVDTIVNSRYMDDIGDSYDDTAEAGQRLKQIDEVLSKGHFKIKEWMSNEDLPGTKPSSGTTQLLSTEDKVLGICWERHTDLLHVASNKGKILQVELGHLGKSMPQIMTKRMILGIMSGVFDVLGYAAPFLIRAKIALQRLWKDNLGWDDDISNAEKEFWIAWLEELQSLKDVAFERSLTPQRAREPILVISCDASEKAYGAVAHIRWKLETGEVATRFVLAKSKVAPLKNLGIPKLEINSCVIGARLNHTIKSETRLEFEKTHLLTDSKIALAWIKSESRSFKPFVSVRVGEIQMKSEVEDWRHIPSEHNVADDVSRGLGIDQLNGRWTHGPDFLRRPEEEWPTDQGDQLKTSEREAVVVERRKVQMVSVAQGGIDDTEAYIKRFSSLRRAVRVTAWRDRFVQNLKAAIQGIPKQSGGITLEESKNAERSLVRDAQRALHPLLEKNALKSLAPTKDEHGIVVVKGRAGKLVSYDSHSPPILPAKSWLSTLVVRHVHQNCGHPGTAACAAKVRRRYWILGVTRIAKTVKYQCVFCREWSGKTELQVMADLPLCRLQPHTPPFFNTSVDLFGPMNVRVGRNKTAKVYGVLFTCLMVRAVYTDLATDYSTEGFLMVLRRFFTIRGYPDTLWSDRGSQLVGADNELRRAVEAWDQEELKNFCHERQMKWKFFTPTAAHQNGCAESMIKTTKLAIKRAIGDQCLAPLELQTVLFEITDLVNSRPIGRCPTDPEDGPYLSPNDLLLGRASTTVPQGPFLETKNPRHRYEFCQKLVENWWSRWYQDVFPALVPRKRWHQTQRDVSIGDYVLVKDPNPIRGQWNKGVIENVFPGADGRIRNVRVKTAQGKYERPITKIVVLHPSEGYPD